MSTDVRVETTIARPRAVVAAFMFDPRNDAAWTKNVIAVNPRQDGRLRAGARVERTVKFLGRTFRLRVRSDGGRRRLVEMKVTEPFPVQIRYELADAPAAPSRAFTLPARRAASSASRRR